MTRPRASSAAAWSEFRTRVEALGGVVLEPVWLGALTKHRVRCPAGHLCFPRPASVQQRQTLCRVCAGRSSVASEARFRASIAVMGATLLEPAWLGIGVPHRVRCTAGHLCSPRPSGVKRGGGVCLVCARMDPATAWSEFRARVEALGGVVLEPEWLGSGSPHGVRCGAGHETRPYPGSLRKGQGMCRVCAGKDPAAAEAKFRARLVELGAELLEPAWLGSHRPHRVRCSAGHVCSPRPSGVVQGQGVCRFCAGQDSAAAWARFRAHVQQWGGVVMEPEWLGSGVPHRVRCAAGHERSTIPRGVTSGRPTPCRACTGHDPATAAAAFRVRLVELGATLLEPAWLGAANPHRVRCAAGHLCSPRPGGVMGGQGVCRFCAAKSWDRFYVVVDRVAGRVKLGITSGDPQRRLRTHHTAGYSEVVRLVAAGDSHALERVALAAVREVGFRPVKGLEHFDIAALALVLDIVDGWSTAMPIAVLWPPGRTPSRVRPHPNPS